MDKLIAILERAVKFLIAYLSEILGIGTEEETTPEA